MSYNTQVATHSLYIHWPFCPYRCHFCPFVALAGQDEFMEIYHQALLKEIILFGESQSSKKILETIYLGGGTPSTYPSHLLLDMFAILRKYFVINDTTEITIEVNPGTVNKEKMHMWKKAGINRISVGVQSLDDTVLTHLNRHQKVKDVYDLLEFGPQFFENISVDLIIGLPGVTPDAWKSMIHQIMQWPIKHISLYFLSIHEETPLYFRLKKKELSVAPDDEMVELYYWSVGILKEYGFLQYEISNFAQVGYESKHNQIYWERKPYKGFGLGACSFDGVRRIQNEKNLMCYIKSTMDDESVETISEVLTDKEARLEKVMLGLRRVQGVLMSDVISGLSVDKQCECIDRIQELINGGFVYCKNDRLFLMPTALAVENEVAVRLSV